MTYLRPEQPYACRHLGSSPRLCLGLECHLVVSPNAFPTEGSFFHVSQVHKNTAYHPWEIHLRFGGKVPDTLRLMDQDFVCSPSWQEEEQAFLADSWTSAPEFLLLELTYVRLASTHL